MYCIINFIKTNIKYNMLKRLFPLISIGLLLGLFFSPLLPVQAAEGTVDMKPGQSATFTIEYKNGGEGTNTMQAALLNIYLGKSLELDTASMTDQFPQTGTVYKVASSVVRNDSTSWGSIIDYQPRSANDAAAPSGSKVAGDVDITVGEKGLFKFTVKLKSDILSTDKSAGVKYAVGDILSVDTVNAKTEGIYSILNHSGTGKQPGTISVKIAAPDVVACTGKAASTNTTGGGFAKTSAQPTNTSVVVTPGNPVTVEQSLNVKTSGLQDSADCTPKTLENATCTALLQGPNSFSAQVTGTVKGGICDVTFTASQTPKTAGTYQVVVQVAGPNGNLQTAPKDVVFVAKVVASSSSSVSSTAPTVLPRTGGIAFAIILAFLAGVGGIAAFIFARRRKMKITK
jgi:hypothetical protein